jgi:hypothetical protein
MRKYFIAEYKYSYLNITIKNYVIHSTFIYVLFT